MIRARGLSLVELLVAACVLAIGLAAVATGLRYAAQSIAAGHDETMATSLAEDRLELLRSLALAEWDHALLAAGTTREPYGAIAGAPRFSRQTTVQDRAGAGCADPAPQTATCKTVRVAMSWRLAAGGQGRLELATVLARRL